MPKQQGPRGPLPPEVERAAKTIYQAAYGQAYVPGKGVMHYGGGPAHAARLRELADMWDRQAAAARICADYLGDGEFPEDNA